MNVMMIRARRLWTATVIAALVGVLGTGDVWAGADNPSPAGLWDAVVVVNGVEVPFTFEISGAGHELRGAFFDGDRRVPSTSGSSEGGAIVLRFDQYAAVLEATLAHGELTGRYVRGTRGAYDFRARRAAAARVEVEAPSIAGEWTVGVKSPKGETAWRFLVRQNGPEVSAAILRVDGDTGTLTGRFVDGRFLLSHFSGGRPLRLEVTPNPDGTLTLLPNGKDPLLAVRVGSARAAEFGTPTDPSLHTRFKDAAEPFRFSFPDLDGRVVTNTDARFQGRVVLVNISGSWCPNCHDEASFLAQLYRKYRAKGLEIVTLTFEEPEQLANPTRLRAFIKQHGIEFPVLLAGEPSQLAEKVPQAENLNAWPTTFVVGRDGRVRGVHAGFPSPASAEFHTRAVGEITKQVERLLAEPSKGTY